MQKLLIFLALLVTTNIYGITVTYPPISSANIAENLPDSVVTVNHTSSGVTLNNRLNIEGDFVVSTNALFIDSINQRLSVGTITNTISVDGGTAVGIKIGSETSGSTDLVDYFAHRHSNTAGWGAHIMSGRSGGTHAAPLIVTANNNLQRIMALGYDGTNWQIAGQIAMDVDSTPGTNDMPGRIRFSTTADGAKALSERMRITNAGNVGIGTTAPSVVFEVSGTSNIIGAFASGSGNTISGLRSFGGGGSANIASNTDSFTGGGSSNTASGPNSAVVGGASHTASGLKSFAAGGDGNTASGAHSGTLVGFGNTASGTGASIAGGNDHNTSGDYSFIGGGESNNCSATDSGILAGAGNTTTGQYSSISGGIFNSTIGTGAAVVNGNTCTVTGNYSLAGGTNCSAVGDNSVAMGNRAKSEHDNTFVWGDGTAADFASNATNTFIIRASSGVGIGTTAPAASLDVSNSGSDGSILILNAAGTNTVDLNTNGDSYLNGGNVGIGTTTPATTLEVVGTITTDALDNGDGNITNVGNIALDSISSDAGTSIAITLGTDAGDDLLVDTNGLVYEGDTNRVGIGTTTPQAILHVNGATGSLAGGIALGDGDSGIYELSDDSISIKLAAAKEFYFSATEIRPNIVTSFALYPISATSTLPNIVPRHDDPDTGIAYAAADALSLVAGGVEVVRIVEAVADSVEINASCNIDNDTTIGGTLGIGTTTPAVALDVVGDWQSTFTTYGKVFGSSNGSATTITTSNFWTTVTEGANGDTPSQNTTHASGVLTVAKAGDYEINFYSTFSGLNADILGMGISINNADPVAGCFVERTISTAGALGNAGGNCLMTLAANDTIRLKVRNATDTDDITLKHWGFTAKRVSP